MKRKEITEKTYWEGIKKLEAEGYKIEYSIYHKPQIIVGDRTINTTYTWTDQKLHCDGQSYICYEDLKRVINSEFDSIGKLIGYEDIKKIAKESQEQEVRAFMETGMTRQDAEKLYWDLRESGDIEG